MNNEHSPYHHACSLQAQQEHAPADNALFLLLVTAPVSQPSPRIRALGLRPATPQGPCRCDALIEAGVRRARRLLSLRGAANIGKALRLYLHTASAPVGAACYRITPICAEQCLRDLCSQVAAPTVNCLPAKRQPSRRAVPNGGRQHEASQAVSRGSGLCVAATQAHRRSEAPAPRAAANWWQGLTACVRIARPCLKARASRHPCSAPLHLCCFLQSCHS